MPKANLVFELPEEQEEHALALKGSSMHGLIWDLLRELRKAEKHEIAFGQKLKASDLAIIEKIRNWVYDEVEHRGLQDILD